MREKRIMILHAFTKKTEKTPEREIRIAHKRLKELPRENQEEP
jgi:phage-related protein